jgi:hypothetical protein
MGGQGRHGGKKGDKSQGKDNSHTFSSLNLHDRHCSAWSPKLKVQYLGEGPERSQALMRMRR